MERRFHRGFTAAEKTELWDRWKRGESLKAIGRAFGKESSSIYFLVAPHGGFRPAERRRSRLALTLAEREMISRGITARRSARSIAKLLGRSPSTVSREMNRNGGCERYRATVADENAWARSRRQKCCKLAINSRLRRSVAGKLGLDWSPEQIAGWLKRTHPEDECNRVSHETIYRSLFVQARGVLKKELLRHLRSKRSMRRSRPVDPNGDRRGHMKDAVSIRQRPAAVEDRAVPGHWEGDLLSGPNNTYIATLVERQTRYVMLAKVAGKDTQTVVNALIKQSKKLPKELYKSLTWDRGKELTDHRRFTMATNIDVYFATRKARGSVGRTRILMAC
jgi:IS30 family transposase